MSLGVLHILVKVLQICQYCIQATSTCYDYYLLAYRLTHLTVKVTNISPQVRYDTTAKRQASSWLGSSLLSRLYFRVMEHTLLYN